MTATKPREIRSSTPIRTKAFKGLVKGLVKGVVKEAVTTRASIPTLPVRPSTKLREIRSSRLIRKQARARAISQVKARVI